MRHASVLADATDPSRIHSRELVLALPIFTARLPGRPVNPLVFGLAAENLEMYASAFSCVRITSR
jgi:hypothetical protein